MLPLSTPLLNKLFPYSILQTITSLKPSPPPTLKSWWLYRWNRFRQRTDKWGLLQWYLIILGIIACVLFSSLYQSMVMDLDRTNRIFYKKVIMDEKRKELYHELDSLIYSDSFFKTYWSLEHWTHLQKEGQWCNWFVSNSQILIKFRRLIIRFGLAACKVSNISPDFITFLRHHIARIENQWVTSKKWVDLGGASKNVYLCYMYVR